MARHAYLPGLAAALVIGLSSATIALAHGLTDPQIAHIAYTAGALDVEAARLAQQKSKNPDVLAFADVMLRDHKAVNEQALELVEKLGVTPEDNDTSRALTADARAKRAELEALDGAAFDKAYLESELAYHRAVNEALETTLIPSASNGELKAFLTTGLQLFRSHQAHAEKAAEALRQP